MWCVVRGVSVVCGGVGWFGWAAGAQQGVGNVSSDHLVVYAHANAGHRTPARQVLSREAPMFQVTACLKP